ncbi:hypothetical protein ABW20_dc0105830 [Dactylellina cionopaga]|nr:hypothetical protein ABW20_dc0105830 [Dactylellina cionopaga]
MASPPKKVAMKPMFFKRRDLSKSVFKSTNSSTPSTPSAPTVTVASAMSPPAASQEVIDITDDQQKTEKKELNDLEYWGRSKAVHASMVKLENERRLKEKQDDEKSKAKETGKKKEQKQASSRTSKRRKSDENKIVLLSEDDEKDDGDGEYHPKKSSRDGTLSPTTPAEPMDPAEFDKILAAYKKKKADEEAAAAAAAATASKPSSFSQDISSQTPLPNSQRAASIDPTEAFKDVIIQVLIISDIENTKPLVFNRKFSQTLGKVRDTWGHMHHFTEEQMDNLVLVWQNETRVFDSTVPRSLGIRFDREGKMYVGEGKNRRNSFGKREREERAAIQNGISPGECKIYFHAMWDQDFKDMLKRREEERAKEDGEWDLSEKDEDEEIVTGVTLNVKPILITLRGKHFKEMKLKVKPNMKVSEVIQMIKGERKLDDDTEVGLHFDGDELEEDMTLEDAEIEHEFQIDVVLR